VNDKGKGKKDGHVQYGYVVRSNAGEINRLVGFNPD